MTQPNETGTPAVGGVAALPSWPVTTLVFLALHLAMAAAVTLVQDEAYYALWASVPSAGYYDHPPMVAWWIWAGEQILGGNRLGVRLVSVLGFALVTPMVWRITFLACENRRAADIAALWYNATVLIFTLGFLATPDAPSVFFWSAAIWAIFEARQGPRGWWMLAGVFLGLGVISKFTNLFLGVGLAGWLLLTTEGRRELGKPHVWIAGLIAVLMMVPFIWWNYENNWIGLERQFGRIGGSGLHLGKVGEYLVGVIVLVTPFILWSAAKGIVRRDARLTLLRWLGLPLVVYLLYHSLGSHVAGNWLAPVFPVFSVFSGIGAVRYGRRFILGAAGFGVMLASVVLAVALWPGPPVVPGPIPPNQVKGWPEFTAALEDIAQQEGARWFASADYGVVGQLNFHLPKLPTWAVAQLKRYGFRGAFPAELCAQPALLVYAHGKGAIRIKPERFFAQVGTVHTLFRRSRGAEVERYSVWPVRGVIAPGLDVCR